MRMDKEGYETYKIHNGLLSVHHIKIIIPDSWTVLNM